MSTVVDDLLDPYPLLHGFKKTFPWHINPHANPFYSPMYYLICRLTQAKNILEIGLEAGYSSYMLGAAAKENGGRFFGIEKHERKARRLKEEMDRLEIPNTIICADSNDIEKWKWCDRLSFVLLDGNHNVRTIRHEMDMLYSVVHAGGIICIHDVWAWSAEAWAEIIGKYDYAGQLSFVQNYGLGILKKGVEKEREKHRRVIEVHGGWQVSDWESTKRTRTGKVVEL